jgi:hypothetical protein
LLIPPCGLAYPVQRVLQVHLSLSPEPGLLFRIPLGQAPFLQTLRRRHLSAAFVRALRRYYGLVRLPGVVHHSCTFLLTARTAPTGCGQRRDLPGSVQGVSVRAWGLRPRGVPVRLAIAARGILPSVQGNNVGTPDSKLSRLNTQPAHSPVNACRNPSRGSSHDSGPVWLANPSLCETLIRDTLPAYPGASPFSCGKIARIPNNSTTDGP